MNYLDIPTLAQDDFSMGRPTFPTPSGGVLTVVGWSGKRKGEKLYTVHCSKCSKDKELFPESFKALERDLEAGKIPCGCSKAPRWTEAQHKVMASRSANALGYTFLGWAEDFKGKETKCHLSCPTHGEWKTGTAKNLRKGTGCPACRTDKNTERCTQPDEIHTKEFMSTGAFPEGTTFWRSDRIGANGRRSYWKYTCPKCSNDEYVKAGLCSGVFESTTGMLKKGTPACRCSGAYRWSQAQREYQIKKEMEQRAASGEPTYTFNGWVTDYNTPQSKFIYICPKHGEQTSRVGNFLSGGCGCPRCVNHNQQHAYINLVIDVEGIPSALKFGIANDGLARLKQQNRTNLFQMEHIAVWNFPTVEACRAAETECKRTLDCGVLSCRELADGWSETTRLQNYDAVVAIYEKWGGKGLEETTPRREPG